MRGLFTGGSADDPVVTAAPSAGGWNGLSGSAKMGIVGGVAVAAIAAIMWPSWNTAPPPPPPQTAVQHPAAPIREYEAAPAVQDVVDRVMNTQQTPPVQAPLRARPIPTEMALYTAPKSAAIPAAAPGSAAPPAATGTDSASATHGTLVKHPDFLIRAGDVIPCLPVGHQNSEKPGFETCQVPVWFRSTNLRRGLLPPHTRLFGQMRSGLQAGEERLGIVYNLIETPWFNMPISSPAGDPLGAAGSR